MARVKVTPFGFPSKAAFELTVDLGQTGENLLEVAKARAGGTGKMMLKGKVVNAAETLEQQGVRDGAVLVFMKATEEKKQEVKRPNPSVVDRLEEMGFPRTRAEEAVRATGPDITVALDWLSRTAEPIVPEVVHQSVSVPIVSEPPQRQPPPPAEVFSALSFSEENSSHVYAWGYGTAGQLGTGTVSRELVPVNVTGLHGFTVTAVACGNLHSLALTIEGRIFEWGRYYYPIKEREEGDFRKEERKYGDRKTPSLVDSLSHLRIVLIAAGGVHSLAIDSIGRVWSWGEGLAGQLGHALKQNEVYPREVEVLRHIRITQVAAGNEHSVALSTAGSVYAWGSNRAGQLGVGDFEERLRPRYVFLGLSESDPLLSNLSADPAVRIACGAWHTVVETAVPQALYSWGNKSFEHVRLAQFSEVHMQPRLIACSSVETFVLTQHGELYQITEQRQLQRIEEFNDKKISGIFSGAKFTICIAEDGSAYAKGENGQGQLGMGDIKSRVNDMQQQFTLVERLSDFQVTAIACGTYHCVAIVKERGLADDLARAVAFENIGDMVVSVLDTQDQEGIRSMQVCSILLESHIPMAQAGFEQTLSGYRLPVSSAALEPFITFLYSSRLPRVSAEVRAELCTYAQQRRLQRLAEACGEETVPQESAGDSMMRGLALREVADRTKKVIEASAERNTEPMAVDPMPAGEEAKERQNVEDALQRMKEYRKAAEERRQRMLQGLESRETEQTGPLLAEIEEPQEPVAAPPQQQDTSSEAERREKRAKILQALEHRK